MTSASDKPDVASEQGLINQLKQELDAAADGLDMATQSRLNQVRQHVLASKPRHAWRQWWATGAVFASLLLLTTSLNMEWLAAPKSVPAATAISDLPIIDSTELDVLMSSEDLELLNQLELYEWLAAEYG